MYDPFDFVKVEQRGGKDWHVVNPADVIPPTVARIRECLRVRWQLPEELINPKDIDPSIAAKALVDQAYAVFAGAWEAALVAGSDPERTEALAIAWSWFKRALALKVGKGILLHITGDDNYKE